jgi:hypothetical protein
MEPYLEGKESLLPIDNGEAAPGGGRFITCTCAEDVGACGRQDGLPWSRQPCIRDLQEVPPEDLLEDRHARSDRDGCFGSRMLLQFETRLPESMVAGAGLTNTRVVMLVMTVSVGTNT